MGANQLLQKQHQMALVTAPSPMLLGSNSEVRSTSRDDTTHNHQRSRTLPQQQEHQKCYHHQQQQQQDQKEYESFSTTKFNLTKRRFYFISLITWIVTLFCLSLRSSVFSIPRVYESQNEHINNNLLSISITESTTTSNNVEAATSDTVYSTYNKAMESVMNDAEKMNVDNDTKSKLSATITAPIDKETTVTLEKSIDNKVLAVASDIVNSTYDKAIESVMNEALKMDVDKETKSKVATATTAFEKSTTGSLKKNRYKSPYTSYTRNETYPPKFAYAYVISGCNEDASHRNYFYDIAISTYIQREAGSTSDVIVYVQMAYKSELQELEEKDQMLLDAMNIHVRYIPKAADESFYRTMLDKFLILGLTQYERVLFMDGDVMARGNLDYLFDLSVRGVLKRNIVTAGKTEPANGGFFMLAPSEGASDRIMAVIRNKEERGAKLPYPHWDEKVGWGHVFEGDNDFPKLKNGRKQHQQWNFYGAFADQGLLYQWVKYEEKSVSIIYRGWIENFDVDKNGTLYFEKSLGLDVFKDYDMDRVCWNTKPCKTPFKDFMHFTGRSKPWLVSPPEGFQHDTRSSPPHFWYNTLYVLSEKMNLGIDFQQWRQYHRPYLGMFPTHHSASKTSYGANVTEALIV